MFRARKKGGGAVGAYLCHTPKTHNGGNKQEWNDESARPREKDDHGLWIHMAVNIVTAAGRNGLLRIRFMNRSVPRRLDFQNRRKKGAATRSLGRAIIQEVARQGRLISLSPGRILHALVFIDLWLTAVGPRHGSAKVYLQMKSILRQASILSGHIFEKEELWVRRIWWLDFPRGPKMNMRIFNLIPFSFFFCNKSVSHYNS